MFYGSDDVGNTMNLDLVVNKVTDAISQALSGHTALIKQVAAEELPKLKRELVFDTPELNIDRSKGSRLSGSIGKKTKSTDSTDEALELLDKLQ